RHGGGPREARIDVDDLGAAACAEAALRIELRLHEPLKADRMCLGRIRTVDDDDVGVTDVTPVVRHRSPPECGRQTDDRGAVSDAGLLFYMHDPQRAHHLGGEVALLAAEGCAPGERDALAAVDRVALGVYGHERCVARLLDALGEPVVQALPADLLPL